MCQPHEVVRICIRMVLFHCPVLWAAKCQILSGCLKQLSATVMQSCLLNQWRSHHLVNGDWGAVHLILKLKFKMSQMSFPLEVTPSCLAELNWSCSFKALCGNSQGGKGFVRLECSDGGGHYQCLVRTFQIIDLWIKTGGDYKVIHEYVMRSIIIMHNYSPIQLSAQSQLHQQITGCYPKMTEVQTGHHKVDEDVAAERRKQGAYSL